MKKFIKFLIVALFVIAAVVGTCVIFFTNYNKNKKGEVSVVDFARSETKQTFGSKLTKVAVAVEADDSTDTRFDVMFETLNNLNDAMDVMVTYYIDQDGVVKDENIVTKVNTVNSYMSTAVSMANEFEIKSESAFYDKHKGANDLLETTSKCIVNYASLIISLSENIEGVNKDVDAKFALIDVYCRVCIDVFSNRETAVNGLIVLKDSTNVDFINNYFKIEDSQVKTNAGVFSAKNTKFIRAYNACNKDEFAKNIAFNCGSVSSITNSSTAEQVATFHFLAIYGV